VAVDKIGYMPRDMAELLRAAIRRSGLSANRLAKATHVSQPTITIFLNGKDIRLKTAQKLADYLGLELRHRRPRK
jgi:plasmid maintenance system antidote protein VapI